MHSWSMSFHPHVYVHNSWVLNFAQYYIVMLLNIAGFLVVILSFLILYFNIGVPSQFKGMIFYMQV